MVCIRLLARWKRRTQFVALFSGVGYWFSITPAVGSFCLFTAVCVAVDFVFQVSFFAAVVAIGAKCEESPLICDWYCCTNDTSMRLREEAMHNNLALSVSSKTSGEK